MSDIVKLSYPKNRSNLDDALGLLNISLDGFSRIEKYQDIKIRTVSEYLWVDIGFYDICEKISACYNDEWLVHVIDPGVDYYLNLYGVMPFVFSRDLKKSNDYYEKIHQKLGESDADAMAYLWEKCEVYGSSDTWAFKFDRYAEEGVFIFRSNLAIPPALEIHLEEG